MKPLSQTDKLILTTLLILLIGIIVWVVWPMFQGKQPTSTNTNVSQNKNTSTTNVSGANANTQPTNLNANIDTSDWKTYRNEELGFEVKYPEEWYHIYDTTVNADAFSNLKPPYPDSYYGFIGRGDGPLFLIGTTKNDVLAEKGQEVLSEEPYKINGLSGKRIFSITKYPQNPSSYYVGIYFDYKGRRYAIEGSLGSVNSESQFNAFVSSFMILD